MILTLTIRQALEVSNKYGSKTISKIYSVNISDCYYCSSDSSSNIYMGDVSTPKESLAFSEYQKLIDLLKHQSILFLEIGKSFKDIRDQKLFKLIGDGGFETWDRFLSQPEIHIKPSTARFYIAIYEQYIQRLKIEESRASELGFSKLQKLLPIVREKSDIEAVEIIDRIGDLGANDFTDEVNKLRGFKPDKSKAPKVRLCDTCGKWEIVARKEEICHCQKNGDKKAS